MKIKSSVFLVAVLVAFIVFGIGNQVNAAPKSEELKIWSAWPEKADPSTPGLQLLISMINEKGKAVNLKARYIGGPEVFNPFEGAASLQKGIVDIEYTAGAYTTGVIPESDAIKLMKSKPWDDRKSGAFALMNKWFEEKGLEFLARASTGQGFQGFMTKEITKPDLKGLTMRVVPIYIPLIKALGATGVNTAGGEVYTALERGTVNGFWWGGREIRTWGWQEVCKYIWGPPFWTVDVYVMMSKKKWDSLDPAQRDVLTKIMIEYEHKTHDAQIKGQADITKELMSQGMKETKFSPADEKWYINMAYTEGWKAAQQKSQRIKELQPLVSK
ncbi:MAG: TRAP transporter substrate-binding protein DctP [Proteobacteria bacterium]|nr:TRAP transporter substrate-binding protein DctP [Pseudomonadota bacterium]